MQDDNSSPDRDELVRTANDLARHARAYNDYAKLADSQEESVSALAVSHHLAESARELTEAMRQADNAELEL